MCYVAIGSMHRFLKVAHGIINFIPEAGDRMIGIVYCRNRKIEALIEDVREYNKVSYERSLLQCFDGNPCITCGNVCRIRIKRCDTEVILRIGCD